MLNITLKDFWAIEICDCDVRINLGDLVLFNEDFDGDLLDNYLIPTFGDEKISEVRMINSEYGSSGMPIMLIELKR